MDKSFLKLMEQAEDKVKQLLAMPPVTYATLPKEMPKAGIYLLSDGKKHLYIGRSNNICRRLGRHCLPGATHRMAAFAFRLARIQTGNLKASYKTDDRSRAGLMSNPAFVKAFKAAKDSIRFMDIRFIEETDPTKQALLEIYAAVALKTPHNDFDTH